MKDISKYIYESIFDEEDIMDKMNDVATINKWCNKLSNIDSYKKSFDELWAEVSQRCKLVKPSKVDNNHLYIVFKTESIDSMFLGSTVRFTIILIEPVKNTGKFTRSLIKCEINSEDAKFPSKIYFYDQSTTIPRPKGEILSRKSVYNNFSERQVYEISPKMMWLIPLFDELNKKINK